VKRPILRSAFTRLPPVARRDQRIAKLERRVARLEESRQAMAKQPSFQVRLNEEKRLRALEVEIGAPSRSVIAGGKFHVYDFVRSHGIDIPEQLGRWDDPTNIPWDDLPDAVVIKSAFGAASRGVRPLRRVDGGWRIATHDGALTSKQLTADLVELTSRGKIRPPFGAEEFLDDGAGSPPVDAKVHSFYGDVLAIELRKAHLHGDSSAARYRVIDARGQDLLDEDFSWWPIDHGVPVPEALDQLVEVATRLSVAIRAPYSRIDLYDVGGRIVFGEVTPRPGAPFWFGSELDLAFGEAWERAQVRLWRDIANGMAREPAWGSGG
jgi:teichuronopeptide biosynthesis TupA-like protein